MLWCWIVLFFAGGHQVLSRAFDGAVIDAKNLKLLFNEEGKSDAKVLGGADQEHREGKLLAQSMYLAVQMSKARKMYPKPAAYSAPEVCYDDLGCFTAGGPMDHVGQLPENPDVIRTKFSLYSRENPEAPVALDYSAGNQTASVPQFKDGKDLVVLIHGFIENGNKKWIKGIREKMLEEKDRNVIIVDWSRGARFPLYYAAVANTALVGRQVSVLLQRLMKQHPDTVRPEQVYLIGYSLGAHVSGFCGRHFKAETGQLIGRITALDAAGPLFESYAIHVSKEDASYVDAIHTSAGENILLGQLGMTSPFAHVDFYPNGGQKQPGCESFLDFACSHRRAVQYFTESLHLGERQYCRFRSYPCGNSTKTVIAGKCEPKDMWGEMGYPSYYAKGRGLQYLKTRSEPPFCIVS